MQNQKKKKFKKTIKAAPQKAHIGDSLIKKQCFLTMVSLVHFSGHLKSDSGIVLVNPLHAFHFFISEILKYMYLFVFDSIRQALMSFNLFQAPLSSLTHPFSLKPSLFA